MSKLAAKKTSVYPPSQVINMTCCLTVGIFSQSCAVIRFICFSIFNCFLQSSVRYTVAGDERVMHTAVATITIFTIATVTAEPRVPHEAQLPKNM